MSENKIKVDVVSDVACPWCFVGKRRLEAALEKWDGAEIEVEWHPFQLDPSMRSEGMNRDTYLTNKFGSVERVGEMTDRLTEVGKTVGIQFDFGDEWLAVNTLKLHQLLHVAREEGFGEKLKERFLSAYFEQTKPHSFMSSTIDGNQPIPFNVFFKKTGDALRTNRSKSTISNSGKKSGLHVRQ